MIDRDSCFGRDGVFIRYSVGEEIWEVWFVVLLTDLLRSLMDFCIRGGAFSPPPSKILLHVSFVSTLLFDTFEVFRLVCA